MNSDPTHSANTVTRRAALAGFGAAGLVAATAAAPRRVAAQDDAAGSNLVGSWRVALSFADGRTIGGLATHGADGTVVGSGLPVQPSPPGAAPGVVFSSLGHGSWEATGADTANITIVHLRANAEGQFLGTLTARQSVTVSADGESFSGELVSTLADPTGAEIATFAATLQATRIVAEAPASGATPEADATPAS